MKLDGLKKGIEAYAKVLETYGIDELEFGEQTIMEVNTSKNDMKVMISSLILLQSKLYTLGLRLTHANNHDGECAKEHYCELVDEMQKRTKRELDNAVENGEVKVQELKL